MNLKLIVNTLMLKLNFHLYQENIVMLIVEKYRGVPILLSQHFLNDLNHMLNTSIKVFLTSISSMKKYCLKITHETMKIKV